MEGPFRLLSVARKVLLIQVYSNEIVEVEISELPSIINHDAVVAKSQQGRRMNIDAIGKEYDVEINDDTIITLWVPRSL